MTALCENCGSISIERAKAKFSDKLVAIVTGRRPFLCRRCGWRARRYWTDNDLDQLHAYGAGGAEPDPTLAVLDREEPSRVHWEPETGQPEPAAFDLDAVNLQAGEPQQSEDPLGDGHTVTTNKRPNRRGRRKRSGRQKRLVAIAGIALLILVVVVLSLTGSCSFSSGRI